MEVLFGQADTEVVLAMGATDSTAKPYRHRRSKHTPAAKGGSWIWPKTRKRIYARDGHLCVYCSSGLGALTLDHIRPARGGVVDNSPANLVTCCLACNSSKQGLSMHVWFARLRRWGINTRLVSLRIYRQRRKPLPRIS